MMDVFRRAAKGWAAKLLIGLLAMSFGVWGIADVFRGYHTGALATVGGEEVSAQEFTQAFNNALQNISSQTGQALSPEDARKFGIDRTVLSNLVQSAAIDDQARTLKLGVPDALIAAETAANPNFAGADGKFNPAEFKRLLEQNGMNEQMYLAAERRKRLSSAIIDAVKGDFTAPKGLVDALHRHRNEQRDARYFVVKTAASEIAAPNDSEIQKQYGDNPQSYTAPEYRTMAIIEADPATLAKKQVLTEDELKAGYEKHKGDYFTPEKRTVLQLTFPTEAEAKTAKDRLAKGEDFLAIAKERGVSEADATFADKTKGDFFDPAVADAAFALAEGSVSDPVKGAFAVTLLKIVKVSPEKQESLEEVKPKLSERLQLEKAMEEIQSIYNSVEDARAAQAKFEEVASRAGLTFQLIGPVDQAGRAKDGKEIVMPHGPELLKAAFASDVGVENDALSIEEGYVWYEVREVIPSAVKPLDTVKDQVTADIVAAKVRALSIDKARKLVDRLALGATLDNLAMEAGVAVQTAAGLKRNETSADFDAEAVNAVFNVAENGFAYALDGDGKGAKVIQSQAVLLPPFDDKSADAKAIADEIKGGVAGDVLASYLGALQKQVGVSINETLWRQISGTQTQ